MAGLLEDTAREVRAVSLAEKRAEIVKRLEEHAAGGEIHAAFYPGIDDNVAKIRAAARKAEQDAVLRYIEAHLGWAPYRIALGIKHGEHTKGAP